MWKLYLFLAYQDWFTFRYYLLRIAVSTASINTDDKRPLNHLVAITDGSHDNLQLPPIVDSCYSHSITLTDGPPPPYCLEAITNRAQDDLFTVSLPVENLTDHSLIIDPPPKIYRLKVQNKYIPLEYGTKIDRGTFDYTHFGKSMFNPNIN